MTGGILLIRFFSGVMTLLLPRVAFAAETAEGAPQQPNMLLQLGPFILIMVAFFFFSSRSQKKKQQQHDKMLASITRGDTVVTAGGFFGRVCDVLDDSYIIELADGMRTRILKGSISSKREGGDMPRPRKLKRKKRPPRDENQPAPEANAAPAQPRSIAEGVSAEENRALIEDLGTDGADAKKNPPEASE
jgi:preprotein translocase subunit YajC